MTVAGSPIRVVLVDDDAKMVELVTGILADDGYDVVGLTETSHVLATVQELDPHVVVLDEVMPDRDGLDLAEEIREHRPEQPIVIFSSLFDRRLSQETERLGFVFCEKAAGVEGLEDAIRQASGREARGAS